VTQSETEQRPHKISFYVEKAKAQAVTKALKECFEKHGVRFKSQVDLSTMILCHVLLLMFENLAFSWPARC
jgi:hypothetical protein